MPRVKVIDREQVAREIEAEADLPLMFSLRDSGLPVEGTCGGTASCGTCHVYVDPAWHERLMPRRPMETDLLDMLVNFDPARSRLSCQIEIEERMDGLVVTLAPEEFF
jgi:2Fe-2S ferredoxin